MNRWPREIGRANRGPGSPFNEAMGQLGFVICLSMRWIIAIILAAVGACGCATQGNLWSDLERAGRPSSEGLQQTQFALIGQIVTPEGRFHVALQRLVITGMLAPRGQAKLLLFDANRRLVASYSLATASPLWCEGSRVYLSGEGFAYNIPVDPRVASLYPDSAAGGNVIDFSHGIHQPCITREKRYGSSGGIEDDPWTPTRGDGSKRVNRRCDSPFHVGGLEQPIGKNNER